MDFVIRDMRPDDLPAVMELLREFAVFEKLSEYCTATEVRFDAALFGSGAIADGLVLASSNSLAGYAIFYPRFSSFRGELGLFLEDLYLRPGFRDRGYGRALLSRVAAAAQARGYERLDFHVMDSNTAAVDFYRRLGAESNEGETHFKFSGEAFRKLAGAE